MHNYRYNATKKPRYSLNIKASAVWTGLEPATPCVTGRYSNQLNYHTVSLLIAVAKVDIFFEPANF